MYKFRTEYVSRTASPKKCQMWLNQWKHNYHIEVLKYNLNDDGTVTMLIRRLQYKPFPNQKRYLE